MILILINILINILIMNLLKPIPSSEAKRHLGEIFDGVDRGESVVISRKNRFYTIQKIEFPQPVPIRPIGYFDEEDAPKEVDLLNKAAAKASKSILPD